MAINTTLYQTSPYFDDFQSSSVEDKGYLKILFKPGTSVQARELNQVQTMIQSQIDKFGLHTFENGSRVLDGEVTISPEASFIDVTFTDDDLTTNGTSEDSISVQNRVNQLKKIDVDGGLTANVISNEPLVETVSETTYRLFVKYTKSTDSENVFSQGQFIRAKNAISDETVTVVAIDTVIGNIKNVGAGSKIHVNKGVYFINGYFVNIEETDVVIEKPRNTRLTGVVAFKVEEQITNYTSDNTLLDNATGYPNASAPGADRYGLKLNVVFLTNQSSVLNYSYNKETAYDLTTSLQSSKFFQILSVEKDKAIIPLAPQHNDDVERMGGVIAQRTFEESGNYCLNPFIIDVREAYNNGANRGRLYSDDISVRETLDGKYAIGIDPSTAYVEGYRVELLNRKEILADKARDQEFDEEVYMSSGEGTYIEGTLSGGLPDISGVTSYTAGSATITLSGIEYVRGSLTNTVFRFFFNLSGSSKYSQVQAATTITGGGVTITPLSGGFAVKGNKSSNKIIPLPRKLISSVSIDDTQFSARELETLTGVAGNDIDINTTAGTYFSNDVKDYIVTVNDVIRTVTNIAIGGGGQDATLTISGSAMSGGESVEVISTIRTALELQSKTFQTSSVTWTQPINPGDSISLGQSDIIEITSITGGSVSLSNFVLDNGQSDSSYGTGKIIYRGDSVITDTLTVNFSYFTHSTVTSGKGYFSRESYPITFDYSKIPSYKGVRLSDVFDFRSTLGASLDPNSIIETTIDYYLPRHDKMIVTTKGEFTVVKGIPSLTPSLPETPAGAMTLYNMFLPAYTFDATNIRLDYVDNRRYTMRDIGKFDKRIKNLEYYTSLSLLELEAKDKRIFDDTGERFKNGILVDSFTGHNIGNVFDSGYKCSIDNKKRVLRPKFEYNQIEYNVARMDDDMIRLPSVGEEVALLQPYGSVHESLVPYEVINYTGRVELSPSSDNWKETEVRPDVLVNFNGNADAIKYLAEATNVLGTQWGEWTTNWSGEVGTSTSVEIEENQIINVTTNEDTFDIDGGTQTDVIQTSETETVRTTETVTTTTIESQETRTGLKTNLEMGTITQSLGEKVVDTSFVPFIRSRRIFFRATGMKPDTRLYCYFDETNITGYATKLKDTTFEDNKFRKLDSNNRLNFLNQDAAAAFQTADDSRRDLITDSEGTIEGYFIIPNTSSLRFKTGVRKVTFTDTGDGVDDIYATSRATASYSAQGLLLAKDETYISTRVAELTGERLEESRVVTKDVVTTDIASSSTIDINSSVIDSTVSIDPVEEVIPEPEPPAPVVSPFVLKPLPPIPLSPVEPEVVPAVVFMPDPVPMYQLRINRAQIVEGDNFTVTLRTKNVPDGTSLAYTITGVTSNDINGAPLTGTFPATVGGRATISFTSIDDLTTEGTETFVIALDDHPNVRASTRILDTIVVPPRAARFSDPDPLAQSFSLPKETYAEGAFLKSIDLFFKQKHETLPAGIEIVTVENGYPTSKIVPFGMKQLSSADINVSDDSSAKTTFTFDNPVHLKANSEYAFIVRSDSVDYRIWMSELGSTDVLSGSVITKDPFVGVSFKSANRSTWTATQNRDIKFNINVHKFMDDTEASRTRRVGPGTTTETATDAFVAQLENTGFKLGAFTLQSEAVNFARTSVKYKVTVGGNTYSVVPGKTFYLPTEVTITNPSDIVLDAVLRTNNKYVSPMIDTDRISIVGISNLINNDDTGEDDKDHGDAEARYITRKVKLASPSDKLSVFLGINRPTGTDIKVYARFDDANTPGSDASREDWEELSSSQIPFLSNPKLFKEIKFEVDPPNDFTEFQVKIVLLSSDTAKVPQISDFRAIATL